MQILFALAIYTSNCQLDVYLQIPSSFKALFLFLLFSLRILDIMSTSPKQVRLVFLLQKKTSPELHFPPIRSRNQKLIILNFLLGFLPGFYYPLLDFIWFLHTGVQRRPSLSRIIGVGFLKGGRIIFSVGLGPIPKL